MLQFFFTGDSTECLGIRIIPDRFPADISWTLALKTAPNVILARGNANGGFVCDAEDNTTYILTIFDSFGDGICCGFVDVKIVSFETFLRLGLLVYLETGMELYRGLLEQKNWVYINPQPTKDS